ncbi:hypothetical protein DFJ74DRAFT_706089 [Hyaloraphidium curvatum]|nr:hypothetical protein DFJ74DRAFT_706089 [Hyaloraphidium curvatum]
MQTRSRAKAPAKRKAHAPPPEADAPAQPVASAPGEVALPIELISSVMEILGKRGLRATLLEFMLASKRCYVLGLRDLAGDLVLGPREGFGPEKLALLARGYEYAGEPVPRLVRTLNIAPGITWTAARLKVLKKVLVGVERLEVELRGPNVVKSIWNQLQGAQELKWLRLALTQCETVSAAVGACRTLLL